MKGEHLITHGKSNTRLYGIYRGMWRRCYNKNHEHYNQYGGRGITICDEWLHDFMNFYKWAEDLNVPLSRLQNGYYRKWNVHDILFGRDN